MAVEQPDTDRVYDRLIRPTLASAGIYPTFMGKLEHNDDIDDRIIKEIKRCDLAIADLTYARPSVYFEAGYAQRNVEVIYTVRKDHLRPKHDDKEGNLRVHFDLQMKNLVTWRDATDQQFARKLAKRIRLVVRPLLQHRQNESRIKTERQAFDRLSLRVRINAIATIFRQALVSRGYKSLMAANDDRLPWVGRKPEKGMMDLSILHVQSSFSARDIEAHWIEASRILRSRFDVPKNKADYDMWHQRVGLPHRVPKQQEIVGAKQRVFRLILCSLNRVPRGRIANSLPFLQGNETGHYFEAASGHPFDLRMAFVPIKSSISIFDGIQSEIDARTQSKSPWPGDGTKPSV